MKKYSKADYENYLNRLYADSCGLEQAREQFGYMFSNEKSVDKHYHNQTLGTLVRDKDITLFNVGYNEYVQNLGFIKG